jgi:hypothetical protein
MSENLRVEKRTEQVSLFMTDGAVFEGLVYLSQYAMHHSGEQTILDLLIDESLFLPMHSTTGAFHLIHKGMISHVRCDVPMNEKINYTQRQVRISFPGDETLTGSLKIDMPDHSARITDYINGGDSFFPLFSEETAYLVNRSLIRDIVQLEV